MALINLHTGIIQYVAIYTQKYKSSAYWWNGRTLSEMLNLDNGYGKNIFLHMAYENMSAYDFICIVPDIYIGS